MLDSEMSYRSHVANTSLRINLSTIMILTERTLILYNVYEDPADHDGDIPLCHAQREGKKNLTNTVRRTDQSAC